jgi:hypothetical protein
VIHNQKKYEEFLKRNGVGQHDKVADSIKSYISYLNGVARHLNISINSSTLSSPEDIESLSVRLSGKVSGRTIQNYRTAMRRYIEMLAE